MSFLQTFPIMLDPRLLKVLGYDSNAAILLSSFLDGELDQSSDDGWFFLSREAIEEFSGLDTQKQILAERTLKRLKLLSRKKYGENYNYYKLNYNKIEYLLKLPIIPGLVKKFKGRGDVAIFYTALLSLDENRKGEDNWFRLIHNSVYELSGLNNKQLESGINYLVKTKYLEKKKVEGVLYLRLTFTKLNKSIKKWLDYCKKDRQ